MRGTTALQRYARLESPGLWRDAPASQRREVVVAFREATLVLSDPRSETALTHWSLPAIRRMNPGELPAVYSPGEDASETLELDDRDMIGALETVRLAVESRQARPGRLRGLLIGAGTALVLLAAAVWLPDALMRHTASVLPAATRAAIGQDALADVRRLTGNPCATPLGTYALTALGDRLFGAHQAQLHIVREGVEGALHLPGGTILIARPAVEEAEGPELVAGLAVLERLRAEAQDPILPVLRHAGVLATFRLLTTGTLPEGALRDYGEARLAAPPPAVAPEVVLARLKALGIPAAPLAAAMAPQDAAFAKALAEGDPMAGLVQQPLMPDGDWISLQDICR